jgi:amphi-Trp domain-containing protein
LSKYADAVRVWKIYNSIKANKKGHKQMSENEMQEMEIDVERNYTPAQTADKLRRIADAIEAGKSFRLQVAGNRLRVPTDGDVEIEMQTDGDGAGEIEIEIKWNRSAKA